MAEPNGTKTIILRNPTFQQGELTYFDATAWDPTIIDWFDDPDDCEHEKTMCAACEEDWLCDWTYVEAEPA